MYHKRTDANHKQMMIALREAGFAVTDTSKCGWGIPDLIICRDGRCEWLEVKAGPHEGLTDAEGVFFDVCPGGPPILAWTPTLAIAEFEQILRNDSGNSR
jgi:Holliday junction resolvase